MMHGKLQMEAGSHTIRSVTISLTLPPISSCSIDSNRKISTFFLLFSEIIPIFAIEYVRKTRMHRQNQGEY